LVLLVLCRAAGLCSKLKRDRPAVAFLAIGLNPPISPRMLTRVRNSRGKPINAAAAFIYPCQPIVAKQPPSGPGWAHELKYDGYRLQIPVRVCGP
jgi:ATP-dependent DNA ligase